MNCSDLVSQEGKARMCFILIESLEKNREEVSGKEHFFGSLSQEEKARGIGCFPQSSPREKRHKVSGVFTGYTSTIM